MKLTNTEHELREQNTKYLIQLLGSKYKTTSLEETVPYTGTTYTATKPDTNEFIAVTLNNEKSLLDNFLLVRGHLQRLIKLSTQDLDSCALSLIKKGFEEAELNGGLKIRYRLNTKHGTIQYVTGKIKIEFCKSDILQQIVNGFLKENKTIDPHDYVREQVKQMATEQGLEITSDIMVLELDTVYRAWCKAESKKIGMK